MACPEVADYARNFGVLVRVDGPDPKGLKMRRHAFHQYNSGKTTLSASGMLLPDNMYDTDLAKRNWGVSGLVLTVASVIEPFLSLQHRNNSNITQGQPKLIPGCQVDVLVEGKLRSEAEIGDLEEGAPRWVAAQVIKLVDISVSSLALQSLVDASSGSSEHGWEVGWSLASHDQNSQASMDGVRNEIEQKDKSFMESHRRHVREESSNPGLMGKSTTRIAILGVSMYPKDLPKITISDFNKRGDFLLAVGSPFGVLSPVHFFNSICMGSLANCYPPRSRSMSLLMADIRCLPGVEGGPVFGGNAEFVGILIRPLRQKNSGAEIQLVIPWEAIATACSDLLLKEPRIAEKEIKINKGDLNAVGNFLLHSRCDSVGTCSNESMHCDSCHSSALSIQRTTDSVCLITLDDGVWASGVLLNDQGLILTNAHLLEPWRFGRGALNGERIENELTGLSVLAEASASSQHTGADGYMETETLPTQTLKAVDASVDKRRAYDLNSFYKGHRKIRVRLDHLEPWLWCDAKVVYVCKGPLDVALLQLKHVPDKIRPIVADFTHPPVGSTTYVIGHGLFGPKCGLLPSVCAGVVSKVVKAKLPSNYQSILQGGPEYPVMLETTAAIHPGGSGGAVINQEGHMIGLVTSNARHGGGTIIPHLNFSIPSAALAPIFQFAIDMQDLALLHKLDRPNKHLASVWALMPPLSPKHDPSLPNLPQTLLEDGKEGKGSRFAKFIAVRKEILKNSTVVDNMEKISGDVFRSKL